MVNLSVNLNKVALLRNSRGGSNPSPVVAAQHVIAVGAAGLTVHWREDNRHTTRDDVVVLRRLAAERNVEFNLEGDCREELIALAVEIVPTQLTLVPVTPGEITSDHGWALPTHIDLLRAVVERVKGSGIRTSLFVDPDPTTIPHVTETGADRIEIYTEPYAAAWGTAAQNSQLARVRDTACAAASHGLGVNAGHDLDLGNLPLLVRTVPELREVSIGHALICDALYLGLAGTVARYLAACRGEETADRPITR